jgi:hypothetical protein
MCRASSLGVVPIHFLFISHVLLFVHPSVFPSFLLSCLPFRTFPFVCLLFVRPSVYSSLVKTYFNCMEIIYIIYIYMYICIHVYICIHTCIFCMYTYIHIYISIYILSLFLSFLPHVPSVRPSVLPSFLSYDPSFLTTLPSFLPSFRPYDLSFLPSFRPSCPSVRPFLSNLEGCGADILLPPVLRRWSGGDHFPIYCLC